MARYDIGDYVLVKDDLVDNRIYNNICRKLVNLLIGMNENFGKSLHNELDLKYNINKIRF